MQRLVYSPKVQAYIRTENHGIVDISPFIVNGSVNRVVNEVSTAELVIRNPEKRFTPPGNPTFRPMDGITVFASRLKDRPVPVFTGYLDQTPYLQLFPGTCVLKASCTLKRLLHTYWDAGLPHTINYLVERNWKPDFTTGSIETFQKEDLAVDPEEEDGPFSSDNFSGSMGDLVVDVLSDIGNWKKSQIKVEALPDTLFDTLMSIYENVREEETEEQLKQLRQFLKDLIGEYGGGAISSSGNASAGGEFDKEALMELWREVNGNLGDANLMAAIALAESGGDSNALNTANSDGSWDAGLWQINSIHGHSQQDLFDPVFNAKAAGSILQSQGLSAWVVYNKGLHNKYL